MNKVTIAIPTLNRAEYLRLAIASALGQTYEAVEVLVSDNASTDHTSEVLASFAGDGRLRVLRHPVTVSMVANWNSCVAAATGEYFLLLSDDDLLDPEALSAMMACFADGMAAAEEIGVVYCRGRMINETGKVVLIGPPAPAHESARDLILNFFRSRRLTWACTILFRTADIHGGYLDRFPLATDAALWMHVVAKRGQAAFLNRVLASYRVHQNISAKTPTPSWQKENSALAEYAIDLLRSTSALNAAEAHAIRKACKRLNVRLVSNLVNQNYKRRRMDGLQAYGRHWRDFASLYGVLYAARGILQLLLPGASSTVGRLRTRLRPDQS